MDINAFKNICEQCATAIAERRLLDALALTESVFKDMSPRSHTDVFSTRVERYRVLLNSFAAGDYDPATLSDSVDELLRETIVLHEQVRMRWLIKKLATSFARIKRQFEDGTPLTTSDLYDQLRRIARSRLGRPTYHEALDAAFGLTWVLDLDDIVEKDFSERILRLDPFARLTIISALTLGAYERFAPWRVRTMLILARENCSDRINDEEMRARTLMGLIFLHRRWASFMKFYPDITEDYARLFADIVPQQDITLLNEALVKGAVADRVTEKLDEFLPTIHKAIEREIKWRGDADEDSDQEKGGDNEEKMKFEVIKIDNPNDKLYDAFLKHGRRMTELRDGNYDLNYSNFYMMIGHSPFFQHTAHFFYPFSPEEPFAKHVLSSGKTPKLTFNIFNSSRFCDTDCYAYLSMLDYVHSHGRGLADMIGDQMTDVEEHIDVPEVICNLNPYHNYVQMCFRFFKASQAAKDYDSPLELSSERLLPLNKLCASRFNDFESIQPSVDTLVWMNATDQALDLIADAQERFGTTAQLLCQKGQALMNRQQWQPAVEAFLQAQLLEESEETAYSLAQCYEAMGQWASAVELLRQIDASSQEHDTALAEEMTLCLIQQGLWDEAANILFRLEFEGNATRSVQRAIGWCSLHQGKFPRAEQYYRGLTSAKSGSWEDLLNLGHSLLLQGRRAEAIEAYRRFVKGFDRAKNKHGYKFWQEAFGDDARTLLRDDYDDRSLPLLMDAIGLK